MVVGFTISLEFYFSLTLLASKYPLDKYYKTVYYISNMVIEQGARPTEVKTKSKSTGREPGGFKRFLKSLVAGPGERSASDISRFGAGTFGAPKNR